MKRIQTARVGKLLFTALMLSLFLYGMESCSKKSGSSKSASVSNNQPAAPATPPPVEEKDGMQITRDAAGNYVINLVIVNLEPVKLMKPVKEGYVVWMTNDAGVPSNIGTIEGANTWTTRKDKTKFVAPSAVKPTKVFITAETDLNTQTPGKQVVWSTGNF